MNKGKELAQMRYRMYEKMMRASKDFEHYTPEQKIDFVQGAFYDVNQYCSLKWGLDPEKLTFGFSIGRSSLASTSGNEEMSHMIFSIPQMLNSEDRFKSPTTIYNLIFHEMGHVKQRNKLTPGRVAWNIIHPFGYRGGAQTALQWLASPIEREADKISGRNMLKIATTGLIKSPHKMAAAKVFFETRKEYKETMHLHTIGAVLNVVDKIESLFGYESDEEEVGVTAPEGLRIFNAKQLKSIIRQNREVFEGGNPDQIVQVLREYSAQNNDENFTQEGYFVRNRQQNIAENEESFEQSEFVQILNGVRLDQAEELPVSGHISHQLAGELNQSWVEDNLPDEGQQDFARGVEEPNNQLNIDEGCKIKPQTDQMSSATEMLPTE